MSRSTENFNFHKKIYDFFAVFRGKVSFLYEKFLLPEEKKKETFSLHINIFLVLIIFLGFSLSIYVC